LETTWLAYLLIAACLTDYRTLLQAE